MSEIIKRRQRCRNHKASKRSWDDYVFGFIDYRGIEIWRCKECKEADEIWLKQYEIEEKNRREEVIKKYRNFWQKEFEREAALKKKKEEELWDCFVNKELLKGMKNKTYFKFPKELLQLKRATIKLDRLLKEKKKSLAEETEKSKYEQEQQDIKDLKRPFDNCYKHGSLYLNEVIKSGKNKSGKQYYKCKYCMKDLHRNHYEKNKITILAKQTEYRKSNPEKRKEIKAKSWRKNNGKNNKYDAIKESSITSN